MNICSCFILKLTFWLLEVDSNKWLCAALLTCARIVKAWKTLTGQVSNGTSVNFIFRSFSFARHPNHLLKEFIKYYVMLHAAMLFINCFVLVATPLSKLCRLISRLILIHKFSAQTAPWSGLCAGVCLIIA